MLSSSNKTKFQYQYLLVAVLILAMASAIALYQSGFMPSISVGQAPAAVDLSWPARPDFSILNQQAIIPVTGSVDGLAVYHSSERGTFTAAVDLSWPARPDFSVLNETVDMPAFHYTSPGR